MIDVDGVKSSSPDRTGLAMHNLMAELYPICRSITGDGIRNTLRRLQEIIPLEIHEVPTGTQVLDWRIPREWNIRDAYVKDEEGRRIIDFRAHTLHVLNYSIPFRSQMTWDALRPHLFTLPDHPDWIPYRTSYYDDNWGFCLSQCSLDELEASIHPGDRFDVCIDSSLEPGSLTYGEYVVRGKTNAEVLLSCHACHPSLCNDNLSGIALSAFLARALEGRSLRYTYRFLFIPGTIGSIAWLALNESKLEQVKHGLVVACVGDPGPFTYKKSRRGNAEIDRVVSYVLAQSERPYQVREFTPYGYDERQYCSPGFNLPVGCLSRTPYGEFPEYHTSADNLHFVTPEALEESLGTYQSVVDVLELNRTYLNLSPKGEPQLGRRGLYSALGGRADTGDRQMAMLWLLNLSDGSNSLLDIAERSGYDLHLLRAVADTLEKHRLLEGQSLRNVSTP